MRELVARCLASFGWLAGGWWLVSGMLAAYCAVALPSRELSSHSAPQARGGRQDGRVEKSSEPGATEGSEGSALASGLVNLKLRAAHTRN